MNDAQLVRRFQRFSNLPRKRQCFIERNRPARDPLREILALDQFHHEGVQASRFLDRIDRRDVGVIERRERLRLALEPRHALRVVGERVRQDLDRGIAMQPCIARPIDLAHAAGADQRDDFVGTDNCARRETHKNRIICR